MARFDGETFNESRDGDRLEAQLKIVFHMMSDGRWRPPKRMEALTGFNWASISARLRDLRKAKWGGHDVQRRELGEGLYEYRLILNTEGKPGPVPKHRQPPEEFDEFAEEKGLGSVNDPNQYFNGPDLKAEDHARLGEQCRRIFDLMCDGHWRKPAKLESLTGYNWASISAQLRHLRKRRFGAHTVNRRNLGGGLYEYQLLVREI